MAKSEKCAGCVGTGILRATVVNETREEVLYKVGINAVLCSEDYEAGEKTLAKMEQASRLPVNVVGVEKPKPVSN